MAKAKDRKDEMIKIRKEIVDFHGEMVLLENYSALNYTGKIMDLFLILMLNCRREQNIHLSFNWIVNCCLNFDVVLSFLPLLYILA